MNDHRRKILNKLASLYRLECVETFDSATLDYYINHSKVLLNLHYYYECAMQEQARIIRWIGAPCKILSEKSWKNYMNVQEFTNIEELLSILRETLK